MNILSYHFRSIKHKIVWWAGKFKKPYSQVGHRKEKKTIKQKIILISKLLLWVNETIEKGQHELMRYVKNSGVFKEISSKLLISSILISVMIFGH